MKMTKLPSRILSNLLITCKFIYSLNLQFYNPFVLFRRNAHREIVLDYELTPEQRSLSVAYGALVSEKLVPALVSILLLNKSY